MSWFPENLRYSCGVCRGTTLAFQGLEKMTKQPEIKPGQRWESNTAQVIVIFVDEECVLYRYLKSPSYASRRDVTEIKLFLESFTPIKQPTTRKMTVMELPEDAWYKDIYGQVLKLHGFIIDLKQVMFYGRWLSFDEVHEKFKSYTLDDPREPDAKWLPLEVEE